MSVNARSKKILAIDWDVRTLRIVHAQLGKRGATVEQVLAVPLGKDVDPGDPEQMGRHIRRALDQEGIRTRHAMVDVPRDQAILNTLNLPVAVPEGLPGMVEIQVAKELPFPISDAVIDYAVGEPVDGSPTAEVLVAAIRREVLAQYEATLVTAGLRPLRIGFRPFADKIAVCALLKHAMPERVLFIDVRPTLSEIDFLRHGALEFSRAAPVVIPENLDDGSRLSLVRPASSGEVGDDESPAIDEPRVSGGALAEVIRSLVIEVRRSIEAYRASDPGARIDHAVIGGDLGIEEPLAEAIQRELQMTAEVFNPASTFGWEPDQGAAASAYAATLGMVLAQADPATLHFDFLHPKKVESAAKKRLKKAPVLAAAVLLLAAAGPVFLYGITKDDREALASIEKRIAELKSNSGSNKKFLKLVDDLRDFNEQYIWVDVLADALSVLPSNEELVINHASFNQEEGRLVLKTQTKRREIASEVIRMLEEEFRRPGSTLPRFKVTMRSQSEKDGEKYPYSQDLQIMILADGLVQEGLASRSR